jgi:hypothetical protein
MGGVLGIRYLRHKPEPFTELTVPHAERNRYPYDEGY